MVSLFELIDSAGTINFFLRVQTSNLRTFETFKFRSKLIALVNVTTQLVKFINDFKLGG